MGHADDLLQALVAGFVCAFVVSVPVGPVNLTVINQALRNGFLRAFLVGLGAVCAETFYATVLMAGHTAILDKPFVRQALHVTAVVVITVIGIRSLLYKRKNSQPATKPERKRWMNAGIIRRRCCWASS